MLTPTEAAEAVGLTPSAVSHHLRALQRWGLAERADATGDARQRPWRGTDSALQLESSDIPGSAGALQSLVSGIVQDFAHALDAYLATEQDDPWKESYRGLIRAELYLTREESQRLKDRLHAVLDEFEVRTPEEHPDDARRMSLTMSMLPPAPYPAEGVPADR